jgi:hypothetical protein
MSCPFKPASAGGSSNGLNMQNIVDQEGLGLGGVTVKNFAAGDRDTRHSSASSLRSGPASEALENRFPTPSLLESKLQDIQDDEIADDASAPSRRTSTIERDQSTDPIHSWRYLQDPNIRRIFENLKYGKFHLLRF